MNELIQMFIGNQEVEFSVPLDILYNYPITELENPTVVKNSFSKTITIEGTPTNNQIFGHYWSVERLQDTSTEGNGIYFNASRKVPFVIYVDGVIYEQGYVKLDNVVNNNGAIQYQITLYGGLGDFFYNLKANAEGEQKKLSDLDFGIDLDFTINAKNVFEAWANLKGYDESISINYPEIKENEKWHTINFMPAYNGLPDNFDADKVVCEAGSLFLRTYVTESGVSYTAREGYVMGELNDELTEWEVRDLRSYLQRPCIRMKKIIEACCNPENNGGYNVELDSDFFNENNSYWEKTWLSLPLLQNLEYKNGSQILDSSKLVSGGFTDNSSNEGMMYQNLYFDIGNYSEQTPSSIELECNIRCNVDKPYTTFLNFTDTTYSKGYKGRIAFGSLYVQLLAFNGNTVIGASQAYNLTSPIRINGKLFYGDNSKYDEQHQFKPYFNKNIVNAFGIFKNGLWCEDYNDSVYRFNFVISNLNSSITSLKLCYFWGSSKDKENLVGVNTLFNKNYQVGKKYQIETSSVDMGQIEMVYISSTIKAMLDGDMGRTGTKVTKELLLNTESSPCDYLLSYAKMFGLYFRKDVENNTIFIETRKTFYDRNNVIDLSPFIDKNKEITIKPLSFDTKWYEFKQNIDKSDFYNKYFTSKGVEYGSKVLNTGYEFIADKKNLLEGNVIKTGIEGLEKSKHFTTYYIWDDSYRPWMDGMKYKLYNGVNYIDVVNGGSNEISGGLVNQIKGDVFGINYDQGMKYYDLIPKLQFHDSKNGPIDGNNVLVFLSGFKNVTTERILPLHYNLSDDNKFQSIFNESTPCWLFTKNEILDGVRVAYKLDNIPCFERYLTENNGTKVNKSLDFGTPQELYIPNYSITDDVNIYSNFWESYIEDLYDVNTRILTCYVKVQGRPNPEWLRRFYWFDNAIWRLNNIIDWNISSYDTTKMEFVKVHNLEDYTSITQERSSVIKLYTSTYNISTDGGVFELTVTTENSADSTWRIVNPQYDNEDASKNFVVLSRNAGVGNGNITATVSQNNNDNGRYIYLTAVNDDGQTSNVTLYQSSKNETYFNVEPSSAVVGVEKLIGFSWFNQGNNLVDGYIDEGDIEVSAVTFESNTAKITMLPNNSTNVKSELITFTSGKYEDTIGIDQLPTSLSFDMDGTTVYDIVFKYNNITVNNMPYWINSTRVDDKHYKISAKPNYYETEQYGKLIINGIEIDITQEKGSLNIGDSYVNPNNFYIGKEGGSQFMLVNIPNDWRITNNVSWITLSQTNGMGNSIVSLTVKENTDISRSTTIIVTDTKKGTQFPVTVYQEGSITNPTFSINPSSTTISKEGGTVRATFTYTDRGSDYLSVNTELSRGNVIWNGVDGYIDITVPFNDTVEQRTFEVIFTNQLGNFIFTIVQEKGDSTLSTSKTSVIISFEGGVAYNNIISNTSWTVINNADWFTISPLSGNGNQTIEITVQPNTVQTDRESVVNLFTVDNKTASFKVSQRQFIPMLSVNPSSLTFDSEGGTQSIKIISNTDWNIII